MRRCVACGSSFEIGWTCPECAFAPEDTGQVLAFAPEQAAHGRGFDPAGFEVLAAVEADSFWFQARNRLIQWAVGAYFPAAQSMLEVGCGTGFVLQALAEQHPAMRVAGAELYVEGLRHAQARVPRAEWYQLDATRIPFEAEWDIVAAFDVLEHVEEDEAFLAGMHTATTLEGGVLITVPQHPSLWSQVDEEAHHVRRYTRSELVQKVTAAGFQVERVTSFVSLLLPAMWLSRRRDRGSRNAYDASREHTPAGSGVLERVFDLERQMIARGVNLPAGGSLLLAGVRR